MSIHLHGDSQPVAAQLVGKRKAQAREVSKRVGLVPT